MNKKDNDTSQVSGEEPEHPGSDEIPENTEDIPEGEVANIPDKKTVKESEVSPEGPKEDTAVTSDEKAEDTLDNEQEEEPEVPPDTPVEEKAETSDQNMPVSDKKPKEDIEAPPETPGEAEPVVTPGEEPAEAAVDKPEEEVEPVPEEPPKAGKAEQEVTQEKEPDKQPEHVRAPEEKAREPKVKEKVVIGELEKPGRFIDNIKRTSLVIVIIIALALAATFFAWTSGMNDLRDDNDYLIVVVFKEAEAASIYHKDTGESEIIDVTELEKISNRKLFFESAQEKFGALDRMIIIDVDTLRKLSTDEYILYKGDPEKKITRDEMYNWIIGKDFPRDEIQGSDSPSVVNANMLKSWLDHYEEKLFDNWGSYTIKVVLNGYRSEEEKIIIYPGNSALFILKYVAIEKIFFPI